MKIRNISQSILTASLGASLALVGFYFLNDQNSTSPSTNKKTIIQAAPQIHLSKSVPSTLMVEIPSFETAASQSVNSVVHIKTISTGHQNKQSLQDPLQDLFFGRPPRNQQPKKIAGSGSGVIISDDGYIATNNHVIEGATKIEVTLNDKKTYTGTIVGTDPTTDLALIKIKAKNLSAIYYGNSDAVNIGEWVLAVGNPFNLNSTVTAGIVSAKGRNINILKEDYAIESFIQTDAAVNPGNSGGALVNQQGELIGINTAIASNTGSYTGYSFAIPVNIVKKIMGDLVKHGTVQRALLGVQIRELNQTLAEEQEIKNLEGVYISKVFSGSSADDSNLKSGDIIRYIDGAKISSPSELQEKIGQYQPGDKVEVTYDRNHLIHTSILTLKNKLGTINSLAKEIYFFGAQLEQVSNKEKKLLKIKNGVKIENLKSGFFLNEGMKKGFIITKLNNQIVVSPEGLVNTLKNTKGGILIEGIYPNGSKAYYGFGL
jgi:serine protease Do